MDYFPYPSESTGGNRRSWRWGLWWCVYARWAGNKRQVTRAGRGRKQRKEEEMERECGEGDLGRESRDSASEMGREDTVVFVSSFPPGNLTFLLMFAARARQHVLTLKQPT